MPMVTWMMSPVDDEAEESDVNMEVNMEAAEPEPVKKTKTMKKKQTKAGLKGKKKVTVLQDKIRAIRKEVPNPEAGLRVQ